MFQLSINFKIPYSLEFPDAVAVFPWHESGPRKGHLTILQFVTIIMFFKNFICKVQMLLSTLTDKFSHFTTTKTHGKRCKQQRY